MNRRSLIKSAALWFGALFIPTKLATSNTISAGKAEVVALTEDFCLHDIEHHPDESFVNVCERLNKKIDWILTSCENDKKPITHLSLHYRNILHQTENPDGKYPFFRIIARRGEDTYSGKPLNGLIIADGNWNL